MYACRCCKSAHCDIPLLSAWSPSESDEEILNDTLLSELGEKSLYWFDELTKASQCQEDATLCASPNVSMGWSPFPKGGFGLLHLNASTPNANSSSLTTSSKDSGLRASIQAIPESARFPQSLNELNWTNAMATPSQKCQENVELNTENKENLSAVEQHNDKKVIHRQLFSPAGSSFIDDSIILMSEGNLTVETEKSMISERELSLEGDVSFHDQEASFSNSTCLEPVDKHMNSNVNVTSYPDSDNNNNNSLNGSSTTINLSHGQESCLEQSLLPTRKRKVFWSCSLGPAQGIIDQCSDGNLMEDGSFCSAFQRTSDLDFSDSTCRSHQKLISVVKDVGGLSDGEKKLKQNTVSSTSHIEKVLSIVFVSQDSVEDEGLEYSRDTSDSKNSAFDSLDFFMDSSLGDEFKSDELRKRQSFDTTPQAKRQKLKEGSMDYSGNMEIDSEYFSTPKNVKNHCSVDCTLTLSDCNKLNVAGGYKKNGVAVSILKNPMTPKSTCKKKVHFSLDINNKPAVKKYIAITENSPVGATKLQALTADTVKSICHPDSSEELGIYFFKNADSCGREDHNKTRPEDLSKTGDLGSEDLIKTGEHVFDCKIKCEINHQNDSNDSENCQNNVSFNCQIISDVSNRDQNIDNISQDHHDASNVSKNQQDVCQWTAPQPPQPQKAQTVVMGKINCCSQDLEVLQPVYVDTDLLDYNFDSSFEASPTFSSQVHQIGPVKLEEPFANLDCQKEKFSDDDHQLNGIKSVEVCKEILNSQNSQDLAWASDVHIKHELNLESSVSDHQVVIFDSDDDNICAAVNKMESDLDLQEKMAREDSISCSPSESFLSYVKCDEPGVSVKPDQGWHQLHSETKPDILSPVEKPSGDFICDSSLLTVSVTPYTLKTLSHCNLSEDNSCALNSVSKRPKKFRYPTAEQIASVKPEVPIAANFAVVPSHDVIEDKPMLNPHGSIIPSNEAPQTVTAGQDDQCQLDIGASVSEVKKTVFSSGCGLDFVTFSEVFKEDLTECKPEVTSTESFPATVSHDVLPHEMSTRQVSLSSAIHTMTAHQDNTSSNIKSESMIGQISRLVVLDQQMTVKSLDDAMLTTRGPEADAPPCSELHPQAAGDSPAIKDEEILLNSDIWAASEFTQLVDDSVVDEMVNHTEAVILTNGQQSLIGATSEPNNEKSSQTNINLVPGGTIHDRSISTNGDSVLPSHSYIPDADYIEQAVELESVSEMNPGKQLNHGFQGFTTASGHHLSKGLVSSVNIWEDSLEDQLESLLSSKKEKSNCKQALRRLDVKITPPVKQNNLIKRPRHIDDERNQEFVGKRILEGFASASNLNINFTNVLSERRKKEAFHQTSLSNEIVENKVTSDRHLHSKHEQLTGSDKLQRLRKHEDCPGTSSLSFPLSGFSTAGGKHIAMSELAKAKAQKLFDAVTLETGGLVSCDTNEDLNTVALEKTSWLSANPAAEEKIISFDKRHNGFRPFKPPVKKKCITKSNVESYLSQQKQPSLKQDQWEDDSDIKEIIKCEESLTPTMPVKSNQLIHLQKSSATLEDHCVKTDAAGQPVSVSFSTGGDKKLLISEKALKEAENFMKDCSVDITASTSSELVPDNAVDALRTHLDVRNKTTIDESVHQYGSSINSVILCLSPDNFKMKHSMAQQSQLTKTHSGLLSKDVPSNHISQNSVLLDVSDNNDTKEMGVSESNKVSESNEQHWCPDEEMSFDSDINFETAVTGASEYDDLSRSVKSLDPVSAGSDILLANGDKEDDFKITPVKYNKDAPVSVEVMGHSELESAVNTKTSPEAHNYPVTFSTCSGATLVVSGKALHQGKHVFDEQGHSTGEGKILKSPPLKITASSEKLIRPVSVTFDEPIRIPVTTGRLHEDAGKQSDCTTVANRPDKPTLHSLGFSTASGLKVTITEKALSYAKILFRDSDDHTTTAVSPTKCDLTPAGEVQEHTNLMSIDYITGGNKNTCSFPGFTTALGNSVSVSEKSWQHARSFLEESDQNVAMQNDFSTKEARSENQRLVSTPQQSSDKHTISLASETSLQPSGKYTNESQIAVKTNITHGSHNAKGFATASGNKVNVSKKALEHAKNFLKDSLIDSDNVALTDNTQKGNIKITSKIHEMGGFATASGNKVNVSIKALEHAKNFLKDSLIDSGDFPLAENVQESPAKITSDIHEMGGFATALGNKVNVSKKALEHAQGFLKDPVMDSEIVAPADNKLHRDIKETSSVHEMGGFATASGSKVKISETALRHVRNVLKDSSSETEILVGETRNNIGIGGVETPAYSKAQVNSTNSNPITPVSDRPTFINDALNVPKRNALTPVTSRCEEFHYDRPLTRSGKRLHPIKPRSLTNELSTTLSASVNCCSKSSFKPPYKKAKLCSEKDQEVPSVPASGCKKTQITKGSYYPPTFKSPLCTADFKKASNIEAVASGTVGRQSCVMEPKDVVTNNNLTVFAMVATDNEVTAIGTGNTNAVSMDLEDDVENQLLCCDFDTSSQTTAADNSRPTVMKGQSGQGRVVSSACGSSSLTRNTTTNTTDQVAPELRSKTFWTLSEEVLEEQRMRQDKIIRSKKRVRVKPQCGRWMESRKQKGALKKFSESGMEPSSGLTKEDLVSLGVSPSTLNVTSLNASEFRFDLRCFYPALDTCVLLGDGALMVPDRCGYAGVEEFYRAFQTLDGVDPSLLDNIWLTNHYRWIVWKLAAYEVFFPHHLAGRSLTPDNVMLQLKYRYDREIDACHRSALKKILERDETSCKRMVLCVASVVHSSDGQPCVELTDGWYSVRAQLDHRLTDLISRKRIVPGDKLITSGAELVGSQDACSPLENKEGVALKLHGNSTRPAPWHSRLGFCFPPSPLCVPIRSLCPEGGHLGCVDVVISRIYPVMYMEKLKDGSCTFRTREEEDKVRQKHEDKRQAELEKMYSSIKLEKKEKLRVKNQNFKKFNKMDIERLWSGKEIADSLDEALNPEEIQQLLTSSQINRLLEYQHGEIDRNQQEVKKRLMDAVSESEERNVAPLLKVKVAGLCGVDVDDNVSCLVTVWRPGSEWLNMKEGTRYKIYNLSVSHVRGRSGSCKVSLTASRQTRLKLCRLCDNLLDMVYEPRQVWTVSDLTARIPIGEEFDFLGVVLHIIPPPRMSHPTVLYAADKNSEFLCIKIWSNSQVNSMKCGDIFVAYSLFLNKLSANTSGRSSILTADCRDLATITTNGNSSRYSEVFSQMQVFCKIPDAVCNLKAKLDTYLSSQRNVPAAKASPSFSKYSAEDFPTDIVDKIFSPMSQQVDSSSKGALTSLTNAEINRKCNILEQNKTIISNKLDQQASFKAGDENMTLKNAFTSTAACGDDCNIVDRRKQLLRDKMAKLLSYDQPAPLDILPLRGSPACKREFKSPFKQ
ncbi:hypothetical protein Btru_056772 [Bulinus truncatus]|nr:hypothetical protein Btru_056772 [Bulinus truncatus]